MSINSLYNCIHQSSAAVLFPVSKVILQTSEAQSCCVPLECVGSSPPRLLETLQLSKCICINTSVINMFNGKMFMFKEDWFLFPNYVGSDLYRHAPCSIVAFISTQLFVWLIGPLHAWSGTRQSQEGNILFLLIWCLNSAAYLAL